MQIILSPSELAALRRVLQQQSLRASMVTGGGVRLQMKRPLLPFDLLPITQPAGDFLVRKIDRALGKFYSEPTL